MSMAAMIAVSVYACSLMVVGLACLQVRKSREALFKSREHSELLASKLSVVEYINRQLGEDNARLRGELSGRPDAPYGLPSWGDWVQKSVIDAKLEQVCAPVKAQGQWVFAMPIDEQEVVSVLGPSLGGPPLNSRGSLQCDPACSVLSPN